MIRYVLLIIFILSGCNLLPSSKTSEDIFDKLIRVHKTNDADELIKVFGQPNKVLPEEDPSLLEYQYSEFSTSINKDTKKIVGTSMPFWKDFDAYAFLEKRFSGHKWIETPIPSKNVDVKEEKYRVEIPDLGIKFEYDNQDPLRRPIWIFFK